MEHVPKADSNLQINQSTEKINGNFQQPSIMSSMKLPILIALAAAILAAILTIILCLSLKGKKKKFFIVNIKKDDHSWENSYKKAKNFINKLNRTERVNLLFGTQNMKMETLLSFIL